MEKIEKENYKIIYFHVNEIKNVLKKLVEDGVLKKMKEDSFFEKLEEGEYTNFLKEMDLDSPTLIDSYDNKKIKELGKYWMKLWRKL
jgi:hypothetical protein